MWVETIWRFFENAFCMSRLLTVVSILGNPFMCVKSVLNMKYLFVSGKKKAESDVERVEGSGNMAVASEEMSFAQFSACVHNIDFLYPSILKSQSTRFKEFNAFCMAKGFPYGAVFVTHRECCCFCGGKLSVCEDGKDVVVYHLTRGTYLGCRFTKKCTKCKTQEHYGHYKKAGKRVFDTECLENEFLLSTEDTAIDMHILKYVDQEVVQGACLFLLKAKVYNSIHGYGNMAEEELGEVNEESVTSKKEGIFIKLHKDF